MAAAISRLEQIVPAPTKQTVTAEDELTAALGKMSLGGNDAITTEQTHVAKIIRSQAVLGGGLSQDRAVRMVHAPPEGSAEPHIDKLAIWAKESEGKIRAGGSEIPDDSNLSQGDLYRTYFALLWDNSLSRILVCPGSIDAISGSIATVYEAIDTVVAASRQVASPASTADRRAFVAVRPPGHHCGEDTPSGFCFVNNVAIGAAYGEPLLPLSAFLLTLNQHTSTTLSVVRSF